MKQKKLRRALLITALILAVQMFFSIVSYATSLLPADSPIWKYTEFGLPEGYRYYESECIFNFSLASTENQYPQTYEKISAMPSTHSIALVIEPLLGRHVDPLDVNETNTFITNRQEVYANQIVRLQYTKIDEETGEAEGMTLTQCVIRQVCKNETGLTLEEGDYIWVKEDYFLYFSGMENMNRFVQGNWQGPDSFFLHDDTKIYSPYGEDLAPLEYESLVFADIYEDATETTVLDIDPVHFTVYGPVGRGTPERAMSGFYASEGYWHRQFAEKFFEEFGVKPGSDPATTDDSSLPSWILPGAVGFAGGVAVCTAALLIVFAVKKRKKQQPPEPDKTE